MTKKEIEKNLQIIQAEIDSEINESDAYSVLSKLNKLIAYMGLSAEIIKDAKKIVLKAQEFYFEKGLAKGYTGNIMKTFLEGKLAEELAIEKYADRINSALVHCSDGLRSIISNHKNERSIENYQSNISGQ